MSFGQILLIFILIGLNGFFTAVEFSVVSSRRTRLDLLVDSDSPASIKVRSWLEDHTARDRLIAASQLGITVVSLALGAVGENAFQAWLDPYFLEIPLPFQLSFLKSALTALPLVISLLVVTSMHVVLGEQVPKVAVLRAPERFALGAAPFMTAFSSVFRWFISLLDWATRSILRLFGIYSEGGFTSAVDSLDELREIVESPEVEKMVDKPEREMLSAVIDFGELIVRQVAVPRTDIVAVEANANLREVIEVATQEGVSKLPVYENDLDQIVGILYLKDLLQRWHEHGLDGCSAREIAREALFVPESTPINNLLVTFRARHQHIALVLDEYGGISGLVTLEDLLEEIVGDLQDSFTDQPPEIQHMPDGSARIDGRVLIKEINDEFELGLVDPHYDTIAGYILGRLGRVPEVGDTIQDAQAGIQLTVEQMDRLRIASVMLRRSEPPPVE
jgi:putative hemolysin